MTWREELTRLRNLLRSHHRALRKEPGAQWLEIASRELADALKELPREVLSEPAPGNDAPAEVKLGPEQVGVLAARMHVHGQQMVAAKRASVPEHAESASARKRHCRYCGSADHDARRCPLPTCGTGSAALCSVIGCRVHSNGARLEGLDREPETNPQPSDPPASDDEEPEPTPAQARLRSRPLEDGKVRARTIAGKRLTRAEKRVAEQLVYPDVDRPTSRGECAGVGVGVGRPCPFVSCSHHLYLDVNPDTGTIKLNFPHLEVWQMRESCSLDVADRGGITLEEVGAILNLTRERIRQVEVRGLAKIKDVAGDELGLPPELGAA